MSFATEVVQHGRGVVWKLDITLDNWTNITYRYSSAAGVDSASDYDPRILGISTIHRGLGLDHRIQATSLEIVFRNEDELADWMADQATSADVIKARMRLYMGIYNPAIANPAVAGDAWFQVGEFIFGDNPKRSLDRVHARLVDDALGFLSEPSPLPTLGDWVDADPNPATNPLLATASQAMQSEVLHALPSVQLAFGDDWIELDTRLARSASPAAGVFWVYPVCATRSDAVLTATDVSELYVETRPSPDGSVGAQAGVVPAQIINPATNQTVTVWEAKKSIAFSVHGKTYKILYLQLHADGFETWVAQFLPNGIPAFGWLQVTSLVSRAWVKGYPLSSITTTNSPVVHPADIIRDLVAQYSGGAAANVDATKVDRVKAAYPAASSASGVVRVDEGGELLAAIEAICASFDFDVFVTWGGKIGLSGKMLDFSTATNFSTQVALALIRSIDETRIASVNDDLPSREQRGAPFNRINLTGFKIGPMANELNSDAMSFDDPELAPSSRVLVHSLRVDWLPASEQRLNPWTHRNIDKTYRPRIQFETDLEALLLELGDYVRITYTRNLGDPFTSAIFQVEALGLDPATNAVQVEALWSDDISTDRPFVLDDETITKRVSNSAGRTVTVETGNTDVVFSSGDLIADGVVAGDHLILRDSTEPATEFTRNQARKITAVVSATALRVDPFGDVDFGNAGFSIAVTDWEIRRSHLTYPTFATSPTNYPDGSDVYGTVSSVDSAGVYSAVGTRGFTAGHKLLDG